MQETKVQSPGWEDPLEKEVATHSSIPAWKIPLIEVPARLESISSQSWMWLKLLNHNFISWRAVLSLTASPNMAITFTSYNLISVSGSCWVLEGNFSKLTVKFQFSSVAQSCRTLCDPMNRSTPGLPVHHQLPDFTQTHIHRVLKFTKSLLIQGSINQVEIHSVSPRMDPSSNCWQQTKR